MSQDQGWRIQTVVAGLFLLFSVHVKATIYGADDFREVYQVQDCRVQQLAESVAVLVRGQSIRSDYSLRTRTLLDSLVCEDERFVSQPVLGQCTGTLISPQHILTASHCYAGIENVCANFKWVFDFKYQENEREELATTAENVYSCRQIVQRSYADNFDYLIVELERPVLDRLPVDVELQPVTMEQPADQDLFALTAPRGLPLKYSEGGLRSSDHSNYFISNLDLKRGSSGGPVFNSEYKLVGVVAQGDVDYSYDEAHSCQAYNRCDEDGCRGEYATRVSQIPNLSAIIESGYDYRPELQVAQVPFEILLASE